MRDTYPAFAVSLNQLLLDQERSLAPIQGWSVSKHRFRSTLAQELGEWCVYDLTARDLVDWTERREGSYATADMLLATLSGAITAAAVTGQLEVPLSARQAPRDARRALRTLGRIQPARRRPRRLSDADIDRIRARWDARLPSTVLIVLVDTAMRSGELVRLRWEDWDARAGTILIRDRKHPSDKAGNHQVIPLLRRARGIVDALSLGRSSAEPRLFPATQSQLSAAFRRAADAAGFSDHRLHDLRHEGISRLVDRRVDVPRIQAISGHRSVQILAGYCHPDPEALHAIWD